MMLKLCSESPLFQHSQENTAHRATPSSTREEGNFSSLGTETLSSEDSDSFEELTRELKHKLGTLKQKHQRRRRTIAKNAVIHLRQSVAFADEHQELHQSIEQLQKSLAISTTEHSKLLNEHRKLLLWRARQEIKESHLRTRISNLCIQQQLFIERQPPECPLCSDNKCDAETHCGHKFCWPCLITWYDSQKDQDREVSCPCCRALLAGKNDGARALAGQLRLQ